VHRLSALAVCQKNCNFRRWMSFRSRLCSPISSRMDWFVRCSFQLIRNMRRYDVISKVLILFLSLAFKVHVSHPYVATGHTSNLIKRAFSSLLKARSFRIDRRQAYIYSAPIWYSAVHSTPRTRDSFNRRSQDFSCEGALWAYFT